MIEIKDLCVHYGEKTVYEHFDLDIAEGKILCVLGESGCGKTTLLNSIAHLIPFGGEIPPLDCSYIFQTPRLLPNLTVEGNLKVICKDGERIADILKATGLEGKGGMYPTRLSGGEAQRVALARAFLKKCDILLMDEPFSSLDLKLKISIMDSFLNMRKEGAITTVFVTHDIDEALYLSDAIVLIKDGKAAYDLDVGERFPYGEHPARGRLLGHILS